MWFSVSNRLRGVLLRGKGVVQGVVGGGDGGGLVRGPPLSLQGEGQTSRLVMRCSEK